MKTEPNTPILYWVTGCYPFPYDMLRHDNAAPATDADASIIRRLSDDTLSEGYSPRTVYSVVLRMSSGETGDVRPNYERWNSFGWQVTTELAGGEVIGAYTPDAKRQWLMSAGYFVGDRDARLNTNFAGAFMVTEAEFETYELPTEDGANSPWCIVGDDLDALINEAFDVHFADHELNRQLAKQGHKHPVGSISRAAFNDWLAEQIRRTETSRNAPPHMDSTEAAAWASGACKAFSDVLIQFARVED